jgi:molybdopterin converting factor small subunit
MSEKKVKILLFASIREKVGKNSLELDLENEMNLKDLFPLIGKLHPELDSINEKLENNQPTPYLFVLNGNQVDIREEVIISPGSELGILPPVGGG